MTSAAARPDERPDGGAPRRARRASSRAQLLAAAVFAGLVAFAGVMLHRFDLSLVDTLDKHVGDWRIALGSPKAKGQRDDIAIVLIDEQTLLDYESRSPLDRALIAELVRALDKTGAKAIGLDLIFDRRTRHDQRLLAALREVKTPVVLGSIDDRVPGLPDESLAIQAEFLKAAGKRYGHVMLARKDSKLLASDSIVRYIAPPHQAGSGDGGSAVPGAMRSAVASGTRGAEPSVPQGPPAAFVDVLARVTDAKERSTSRVISWLRPLDDRTPVFSVLRLPRHNPGTLKPGLDGVFGASWREQLKGRIVLVGAEMVDRDQLLTPLSVLDRSTMPGVFIHAQALAQRIDGERDVRVLPDWVTGLVAGGVAFLCFMAARWSGINPQGVGYGALGVVMIGFASYLAFMLFRIDFPSIALATAWAVGGFAGFSSEWVFRQLGIV